MLRYYSVNGTTVGLFTIGDLGKESNRHPKTLRKWEASGILPKPLLVDAKAVVKGKLRLYLKEEISTFVFLLDKHNMGKGRKVTGAFIADLSETWRKIRIKFQEEHYGKKSEKDSEKDSEKKSSSEEKSG